MSVYLQWLLYSFSLISVLIICNIMATQNYSESFSSPADHAVTSSFVMCLVCVLHR